MNKIDRDACDEALENQGGGVNASDFHVGFEAALAHRDAHQPKPTEGVWNRIETVEDLPKGSGEYLWRYPDGRVELRWYGAVGDPDEDYITSYVRGYFEGCYVAWMPIPPYQQPEDGGER